MRPYKSLVITPKDDVVYTCKKVYDTVEERNHVELDEHRDFVEVSDGFVDVFKEIQSQNCNAGLENIIKLQTLRYGTIENAIARNKEKQVFADVSHIPTSVGEQADAVKQARADIKALADKYGVSVGELLTMNQSDFEKLASTKDEGGAE